MEILFYESVGNGRVEQIHKIIGSSNLGCKLEVYQTIDSLSYRLSQPTDNPTVAILCADRKKDLSEILLIKDLLNSTRVILVLPDREEDTVAKGHSLRPRFLTYADSDFKEIVAVLSKMVRSVAMKSDEKTISRGDRPG